MDSWFVLETISVQGTAAALVLGKQLERAVSFPDLECLVKVGAFVGNRPIETLFLCSHCSLGPPGRLPNLHNKLLRPQLHLDGGNVSRRKSTRSHEILGFWHLCFTTWHISNVTKGRVSKDFRSGRNPKGLNLYIPRRKSGDFGSSARLVVDSNVEPLITRSKMSLL